MTATCGQCEGAYADTLDGRRRHQMLNGHPVCRTPLTPERARQHVSSSPCRRLLHTECGGGLLWDGVPTACACPCHAGDWERAVV